MKLLGKLGTKQNSVAGSAAALAGLQCHFRANQAHQQTRTTTTSGQARIASTPRIPSADGAAGDRRAGGKPMTWGCPFESTRRISGTPYAVATTASKIDIIEC